VVKVGVFTTDLSKFNQINEIYADYVCSPYPARAAVEVAALPKGARIEMEAIAHVK
jgi:enamine deaminase RidA (YjgF/YER057c/UK114 family)